jgi:hypothetical protein
LIRYWAESFALMVLGGQIMGGAIDLVCLGETIARRGPIKRLLTEVVRVNKALIINS